MFSTWASASTANKIISKSLLSTHTVFSKQTSFIWSHARTAKIPSGHTTVTISSIARPPLVPFSLVTRPSTGNKMYLRVQTTISSWISWWARNCFQLKLVTSERVNDDQVVLIAERGGKSTTRADHNKLLWSLRSVLWQARRTHVVRVVCMSYVCSDDTANYSNQLIVLSIFTLELDALMRGEILLFAQIRQVCQMWALVATESYKSSSVPSLFFRHDSGWGGEATSHRNCLLHHNSNREGGKICFFASLIGDFYSFWIYGNVWVQLCGFYYQSFCFIKHAVFYNVKLPPSENRLCTSLFHW